MVSEVESTHQVLSIDLLYRRLVLYYQYQVLKKRSDIYQLRARKVVGQFGRLDLKVIFTFYFIESLN